MARTQSVHWWFVARRKILRRLIARLSLPVDATLLEVGCGPGGNLAMLASLGTVKAMEYDERACEHARSISSAPIEQGALPGHRPFNGEQFDLVCLFDVIEHIEDDRSALRALRACAKPGGLMVVTAPAYGWLYSDHDRTHHHFRRYTERTLRGLALEAGWQVVRSGYFNALLLPLAAGKRLLGKVVPALAAADDAAVPGPWANRVLQAVFALEQWVLVRCFFPAGLSVIAVLRAPPAQRAEKHIGRIPGS